MSGVPSGVDLDALIKLAQDKSSAGRNALLETITDLFLAPERRLNEHERALMTDILSRLLHVIEKDLRRSLSESLLRSGVDLPELHVMLANDEVEVAEPILRGSNLLKDTDLIEVVRMRTDEHRIAIAVRAQVSEQVADSLVEHGGADVVEALIRNPDAELSRRAMQYLVAESRRVDRFQEPLLSRDDLPSDLAYRMYWWVSAALRRKVLSAFELDSLALDDAMQDATHRALAQRADENGAIVRAQKLVGQLAESGELTISFLVQALRQQRLNVFVAGLAHKAEISFAMAWRIFSDRGFESFIIAAKALGIDRNTTTSIVLLIAEAQNPAAARRPEVLNTIIGLYDSIGREKAQRVLKIWQRDIAYQNAIDAVDSAAASNPLTRH
ncbi:MAG: DUF2336 domain-containing protein [Sphingomonadales bacterium]